MSNPTPQNPAANNAQQESSVTASAQDQPSKLWTREQQAVAEQELNRKREMFGEIARINHLYAAKIEELGKQLRASRTECKSLKAKVEALEGQNAHLREQRDVTFNHLGQQMQKQENARQVVTTLFAQSLDDVTAAINHEMEVVDLTPQSELQSEETSRNRSLVEGESSSAPLRNQRLTDSKIVEETALVADGDGEQIGLSPHQPSSATLTERNKLKRKIERQPSSQASRQNQDNMDRSTGTSLDEDEERWERPSKKQKPEAFPSSTFSTFGQS